jgi:glutamyl-tRNA reductase
VLHTYIYDISRLRVKELNISTLASLYIFEVTCFIRKYCQSLEQNSQVHQYNNKKSWISILNCKRTEIYKKSVINMGTKVCNNLPKGLKGMTIIKPLRKS